MSNIVGSELIVSDSHHLPPNKPLKPTLDLALLSLPRRSPRRQARLSFAFDMRGGTYTRIVERELIEYMLDDGRLVLVEFGEGEDGAWVRETFDAESAMEGEQQRQGWQAILDNFARYVEAKTG